MSTDETLGEQTMRLLSERENIEARAFASAHYARVCRHPFWPWRRNKKMAVQINCEQTGIGFGVRVTCPWCGESENITDYENW